MLLPQSPDFLLHIRRLYCRRVAGLLLSSWGHSVLLRIVLTLSVLRKQECWHMREQPRTTAVSSQSTSMSHGRTDLGYCARAFSRQMKKSSETCARVRGNHGLFSIQLVCCLFSYFSRTKNCSVSVELGKWGIWGSLGLSNLGITRKPENLEWVWGHFPSAMTGRNHQLLN